MISKMEAGYQLSIGSEQCENCVMFRSGSCDLVIGMIEPYAICRYWEVNPGDVKSVTQHLSERGQNVSSGPQAGSL